MKTGSSKSWKQGRKRYPPPVRPQKERSAISIVNHLYDKKGTLKKNKNQQLSKLTLAFIIVEFTTTDAARTLSEKSA